jgi:hypothetical protein
MYITKKLDRFIEKLPAIALPEYLKASPAVVDYGYLLSGEFVLPFVVRKRLFFQWVEFVTTVLNGSTNEEEQLFLEDALALLKKEHSDFVICRNTAIFSTYPINSKRCVFGSYKIDLKRSEENLFTMLHSKHRNVIKKAERDGIVISNGKENFQDCISLIQETYRRQVRQGFSLVYFENLKLMNQNVEFWIARGNDGMPQGCAIFLWNEKHICYYMHGGSVVKPHSGAMNYLIWKAILSMKERGVACFDFVGARINPPRNSKYEGIQKFKARFGGILEEGYLFKVVFSKFNCKLYQFVLYPFGLIKGIKYSGDVIDQEWKRGNR